MAARDPGGAHLVRRVSGDRRGGGGNGLLDPAASRRAAAVSLRGVALQFLRRDPACLPARERARSPTELADGAHEPDRSVLLLEYELQCGASHVSARAVSRAAAAARGD